MKWYLTLGTVVIEEYNSYKEAAEAWLKLDDKISITVHLRDNEKRNIVVERNELSLFSHDELMSL